MSDCNKKRALEIEDGTAIASKREREEETDIDIQAVANSWSPAATRHNRTENKVSSLEDGNLRGGNFVLDGDGNAATLSFALEVDGSVYGLTAGHLADVDDSIFCFFLNSKTPNDFDGGSSYEILELGTVVSKNVETDSLIFEITNPYMVGSVDLLQLVPQAGLGDRTLRLPQADVHPTPPRLDTKVVLFGAMRLGEVGLVTDPCKSAPGRVSKKGDVGISSDGNGTRPLSAPGDCGTIYVTADGLGLAMHHCLRGRQAPYVSYGIPLASIFAKHPLLGGEEEEQQQRSTQTKSKKQPGFESRNIAKFETKVTKAVPGLGQDEATIPESRDIAKFDSVRTVQAPKRAQEE